MNLQTGNAVETSMLETFKQDVLTGLSASPKQLQSKYFYDSAGDKLFQQIMASADYYLTDAELEIFSTKCREMLDLLREFSALGFDVIELGAGDALKSSQLLKCLTRANIKFTYFPIDISKNVVQLVEKELPKKIPGLNIQGIQAEYFSGLKQASGLSAKHKLVLFLGSNIGNMPPEEAENFLIQLHDHLSPDDLVLIGFDLKKNPWTIFNAYNDAEGITKEFNLNLLRRINRQLQADFVIENWEHYESYDPESGACKSYLISTAEQKVHIDETEIYFAENEHIFMETSHKYTLQQIESLSKKTGFETIKNLFDSKKWFTDVIWRCK